MNLEIEVISKEIIKPSFPTPDHLKHYQLSFLDQIAPPVYCPFVLFYPNEANTKLNNRQKSAQLKQSLSEALTHFYPLAGRIKDNLFVDCNDEGVPYLEAKVNCQLCDLKNNSVHNELRKLIPFELDGVQEVPLGIQFNICNCGGLAICLGISHKIGDALSTITFVKSWAAISRGESANLVRPEFISATLFPPRNLEGFKPGSSSITKDNVVTKRFVFEASSIEAIKAKNTTSLENDRSPSRIEALSVFLFTRFMDSTKLESSPNKTYGMHHAVNLRTRMDPPLPEHSFGNYYRHCMTFPKVNNAQDGNNNYGLISQLRESINKIDKEYVESLKVGNQYLDHLKESTNSLIRGEKALLSFSSLCRFPQYEANFGWGKPLWVGSPSLAFNNFVIFTDTASGDGIEALVHLKEEDMVKFQEDEELLSFVAPPLARFQSCL